MREFIIVKYSKFKYDHHGKTKNCPHLEDNGTIPNGNFITTKPGVEIESQGFALFSQETCTVIQLLFSSCPSESEQAGRDYTGRLRAYQTPGVEISELSC